MAQLSTPTKSRSRKKAKPHVVVGLTKKQLLAALKKAGKPVSTRATKEQLKRKLAAVKAVATKERKRQQHEKRSIAARQGWQTRKQKSPELRKWEAARREIQKEQLRYVEMSKTFPKITDAVRVGRLVYFPVDQYSIDRIHQLLLSFKRRDVNVFRMEREVPVGEYSRGMENQVTRAGFISTNWIFPKNLTETELLIGNKFRHWPSLKSMRVPGIDFMRWVVISDDQIAKLPQKIRTLLRNAPIEFRDLTGDERTFYLTHKRRATKRELTRMRKVREKLEKENAEREDDFDEDDEE